MKQRVGTEIRRLLLSGERQGDIARATGASRATISYHRAKLGLQKAPRKTYDWKDVQVDLNGGATVDDLMAKYGMARMAYTKAVRRGAIQPRDVLALSRLGLAELLIILGGVKPNPYHRRLIRRGLIQIGHANECAHCNASEWFGHRIVLEVHHIDGNPKNNVLSNFELRCPNCHSITPNWRGRNTEKSLLRGRPIGSVARL